MNFNDFIWHDAVIKNITVDRSNPGTMDIIALDIEWSDSRRRTVIVFEEVYWSKMNLNFGIVAEESISDATELDEGDQDLENVYAKWKGNLQDVALKIYTINLNSTGSEIKIIAKGFKLN